MTSGRDIIDFKRRAECATVAMSQEHGEIARFCYDDARFYITRAIEIASKSACHRVLFRLRRQRSRLQAEYRLQARYHVQSEGQRKALDQWEVDGGASKKIAILQNI